jgi:putative ABC transport system permease protein
MFRTYLKIAWRSLNKHRLFSFINIFGLALSMSVCMIVMLRIKDEFRYDLFHPYPERTYRIITDIYNKNGDDWTFASSSLPLKQALQEHESVIQETVQLYPAGNNRASYQKKEIQIKGSFTEDAFFRVFGFRLLFGNPANALSLPQSIVLSASTAEKFFRKENPLGKMITVGRMGDFMVTGVLADGQGRSHIDFDAYLSLNSVPQLEKSKLLPSKSGSWNSFQDAYNYVLLKPGVNRKSLGNALSKINKAINTDNNGEAKLEFNAQPLQKITPGQEINNEIGRGTTWGKLFALVGIGLIILISACFNYTNLTIARALTRAREVGIRKVAGAKRYQVFLQYIVESVLISLLSLVLAGVMLAFIVRFNLFGDGDGIMPSFSKELFLLIGFLVFALVTGVVAGAAPAWILSSFRPINVLKNISTQKIFGNISLQKTLIVFQFSLSLVIVIFLTAFYKQFDYMSKADYGFRQDNIITLPLAGADEKILANELLRISGVEKVAAISNNFGRYPSGSIAASLERNDKEPLQLNYYYADEQLVPLMNLQLQAGKNFSSSDEKEKYILLNEEAVKRLHFKNNDDIIGKRLWINDTTNLEVIGVVKNFHYQNMGVPVAPMALRTATGAYEYLNLQVNASDKEHIVSEVEKTWKEINPHEAFTYTWLDKQLYEMNSQKDTISILGYLAFIAITLASLGLLGLVVYTIETRRKEISIRKIIGAEVLQLVMLLSRSFVKLLIIAGFIAIPAGYILSYIFLQNFASRTSFGAGSLLTCFLFLLTIGLITIISQTLKAATVNPVENLRTE